jgi:phasin family protein
MTTPAMNIVKTPAEAVTKVENTVEQSLKGNAPSGHSHAKEHAKETEHLSNMNIDAMTKSGQAAERIIKGNADALTESSKATHAGFQELAKAYSDLAARNSAKLTESIKALGAVKSPFEFVQMQQKLVKEAFESALADSKEIADLTVAVFNAAFEPMQRQVEAVKNTTRNKNL